MNLKKHLNPLAISIILTSVLAAGLSGCKSGVTLIPESVIVRDTVIVTKERTLTDTLVLYKDTTIIQEKVKLKVDFRDSLVYVKVDCPPDTIRINTVKIVAKSEPLQKENKFAESTKSLSVLLLIIFFGLFVMWLVKLSE